MAVLSTAPLLALNQVRARAEPPPGYNVTNSKEWAGDGSSNQYMKAMSAEDLARETGVSPNKDNQYIVWAQYDKERTSSICWGTEAIVVTEKPIAYPYNVDSQTKFAEYNVRSGGNSTCGKLSSTSLSGIPPASGNQTQTAFYLDTKQIEEAYLEENRNYKGETITVYLQPVIYTYSGSTIRKSNIRDYLTWKNAEAWANPGTFTSHYNIKVTFKRQMVKLVTAWKVRSSDGSGYEPAAKSVKAKVEKEVPLGQVRDDLNADNHSGAMEMVEASATAPGTTASLMSAPSVLSAKDSSGGRVKKYMCVGFQYYYYDEGGDKHVVSQCHLGPSSLKKVSTSDGKTYNINGDKRYDANGKLKEKNTGKKTAAGMSRSMNTKKYACFPTSSKGAKAYHLVWLYLPVEDLSVTVKSYYCQEDIEELPEDSSVPHSSVNVEAIDKTVDTVKKGDDWDYRYGKISDDEDVEYVNKPRIARRKRYKGTTDCYLWKVEIEGAECASDAWLSSGKAASFSTKKMYKRADYESRSGGWYEEVSKIVQVYLENIKKDVTIKCYYSITVPVRILVYQHDGDKSYQLDHAHPAVYYSCGAELGHGDGKTYTPGKGVMESDLGYEDSGIAPYCRSDSYGSSYSQPADSSSIGRFYNAAFSRTRVLAVVPPTPLTAAAFFKEEDGGDPGSPGGDPGSPGDPEGGDPEEEEEKFGYTTVRYIHAGSSYIKVWDEFTEMQGIKGPDVKETYYNEDINGDGVVDADDCTSEEIEFELKPYTAVIGFPLFSEYDTTGTGKNGSIYQLGSIVYSYSGPKHGFKNRSGAPSGMPGSNNMKYNLGPEPGTTGDSLVVVAVYEDCCSPGTVTSTDTPEPCFEWNWELPQGYGLGSAASDPSAAGGAQQYLVNVSGTNESGVFEAQQGIPSSEYVRVRAQVPRFITNGFWTKHTLKSVYRIIAYSTSTWTGSVTYIQSNTATGELQKYDRDREQNLPHWWTNERHEKIETAFTTYYGQLHASTQVVERSAVYYKLGEANVWDPSIVTVKNDTFADSACTSGNICTLAPGFRSGAYFATAETKNYELPAAAVPGLLINTNGSSMSIEDLAESIIGQYGVCNDQVEFFDGMGHKIILTTSSTGLTRKVKEPKAVPEATMTDAGVFDSDNYTKQGIQLIPTIWNGHHDTVSAVTYEQAYAYRTPLGPICSQIADDGDDDVEIFTPAVNYSKVCLTPGSMERDADGTLLNPDRNYNQRCYGEGEYHPETMVLDMEYKMLLSASGFCSGLPGYGAQNYARYLEKNADGNPYVQVKFPFPVEMTLTLADGSVDTRYYLADTWISLAVPLGTGEKVYTFLLPSWAHEYDSAYVVFRSITINARANSPGLDMQGTPHNDQAAASASHENEKNYVAYAEQEVQTVGRLYGFQIIDISDYPAWQPVFREFDEARGEYKSTLTGNAYRSGVKDQNGFGLGIGQQWVVPTIDGSHPTIANAGTLGTGFKVRYKIESVGEYFTSRDRIEIFPEFYYMNADGEYLQEDGTYSADPAGRKAVDVYYNETIGGTAASLVKAGSDADKLNQKKLNVTGEDFGILERVIKKTAESLGITEDQMNKSTNQYCFGSILMTGDMRAAVGDTHDTILKDGSLYSFNPKMYGFAALSPSEQSGCLNGKGLDASLAESLLAQSVSQKAVLQSVQNWYGEYYLPSDTFATAEDWDTVKEQASGGFDGSEDCWLQGGYLVVNFQPVLTTGGKDRLAYDNTHWNTVDGLRKPDECNMWEIEGYRTERYDYNSRRLQFKTGDAVLYSLGGGSRKQGGGSGGSSSAGSAKDSYGSHGTH